MDVVRALFVTLAALVTIYVARWWMALSRSRSLPHGALARAAAPGLTHGAIGFITNFFDTLGIGSFATTTAIYKLRQLVPDERIPGTMLVGHTLPVAAQAFAFISVVSVDPRQLVLLIIAMMSGGWLGAGTVSRLPRRVIQVGMAAALLLAGLFMTMGLLQLYPAGGDALSLTAAAPYRGAGWQLCLRRARDARDRQLWAEPRPFQSPRHGAPRSVSHHDGFGSVHGHGRGDALREQRTLLRPGGAGAHARRHTRRVDCRLAGAVVASRHRPLGGDRRGGLHGRDADTFGGRRTADTRRRACECSSGPVIQIRRDHEFARHGADGGADARRAALCRRPSSRRRLHAARSDTVLTQSSSSLTFGLPSASAPSIRQRLPDQTANYSCRIAGR